MRRRPAVSFRHTACDGSGMDRYLGKLQITFPGGQGGPWFGKLGGGIIRWLSGDETRGGKASDREDSGENRRRLKVPHSRRDPELSPTRTQTHIRKTTKKGLKTRHNILSHDSRGYQEHLAKLIRQAKRALRSVAREKVGMSKSKTCDNFSTAIPILGTQEHPSNNSDAFNRHFGSYESCERPKETLPPPYEQGNNSSIGLPK